MTRDISKAKYLSKYYSENSPDSRVSLDSWNLWIPDLEMAFNESKRDEFLNRWGSRMRYFDFNKMKLFYESLAFSNYDDDLKKFFAFLAGDGFFDSEFVSFENWVNKSNFINTHIDSFLSINEALKHPEGMNFVKTNLPRLHWLRE